MKSIIVLTMAILLASQGHCSNVLYLHSVLSPSHHLWNSRLAKSLAHNGHNVTFLSIDGPRAEVENLHYVVIENVHEAYMAKILEMSGSEDLDFVKYATEMANNKIFAALGMNFFCSSTCDAIMKSNSTGIDQILAYPSDFKFDLVVNDITCGSCLLPIIQKFNFPPTIGVTPFLNPPYTNLIVGGHKHPAYVPHYLLNYPQIMTFCERSFNLVINFIEQL
jgi:glucuronosyltransferase